MAVAIAQCLPIQAETFGPEQTLSADPAKDTVLTGSQHPKCAITLTFDDGPHGHLTPQLLEILAKENMHVNFFVLGERIAFRQEDLLATELAGASVVTLFLSPDMNLRLRPRLQRELAPGARIVSHWHRMGDWRPDRTRSVWGGERSRELFLWVKR